jgi:hypothetical protein
MTTPAPIDPQIQKMLDKAQLTLSQGKPKEAAALFAQVAQQLEGSHPRRAANIHVQAAHAYADSGDEANTLTQARAALSQFKALEMGDRLVQFYTNLGRKLQNHSMNGTATVLQKEFGAAITSANTLSPAQLNQITQANQLLASNHPLRAANLFAEVAGEIETDRPKRAANLHAGAAHAFADGENEAKALTQARAALGLFLKNEMGDRAGVFYTNISKKLRNKGGASAADLLQQEFGSQVGATSTSIAATPATAPLVRGRLPSSCPTCGGPARSDEADWIDEHSAACIYCGGVLQAT